MDDIGWYGGYLYECAFTDMNKLIYEILKKNTKRTYIVFSMTEGENY